MLNVLITGLIIVVVCFFPVMLVARKLDAGKSDLIDCIIAIFVAGFVSSIVALMLPGGSSNPFLATTYAFLVTGIVYKFMLETTYIKGILIAIIPAIFYFVLGLILA